MLASQLNRAGSDYPEVDRARSETTFAIEMDIVPDTSMALVRLLLLQPIVEHVERIEAGFSTAIAFTVRGAAAPVQMSRSYAAINGDRPG